MCNNPNKAIPRYLLQMLTDHGIKTLLRYQVEKTQ